MALINCSECGARISSAAVSCPSCGFPKQISAHPSMVSCGECGAEISPSAKSCPVCGCPTKSPAPPAQTCSFADQGDGSFNFSAPYATVFGLVERALRDCEVKIKESSSEQGRIAGKASYGVNPFGMTVVATFAGAASSIQVEVTASFTDAFDTFGACRKKVAQISRRAAEIARAEFASNDGGAVTATVLPPARQPAGASSRGKAITGLCLSIGGLLFGPTSIVGLIMCGAALTDASTSSNQAGRGIATVGLVIGFVALIGWIMILLQ